MSYVPPAIGWAVLASVDALEAAMVKRDLSGAELAKLASTHKQNISNIRRNRHHHVRADIALRIERALAVPRGSLFHPVQSETNADGARPGAKRLGAVSR